MSTFSIDLHCHPFTKPYGRSFQTTKPGKASTRRNDKNCAWHQSPPSITDRLMQRTLGITKFTQSDFTSLAWGEVRCVCASLYSVEREFTDLNVLGESEFADIVANIASSLSLKRIQYIQNNLDYFKDLIGEYEFMKELHQKEYDIPGGKFKYIIVKNFGELEFYVSSEKESDEIKNIYIIVTIEGMHDLISRADQPIDEVSLLHNIDIIKNWEYKPFFMTFAHHFYNKLCGHARTMYGFPMNVLLNQKVGMDEGFTEVGWKALKKLIDNQDGKQIHIDIKHMSVISRKAYIKFLKEEYTEDYKKLKYPIIISHGACNGKMNDMNPVFTPGLEKTAARMFPEDINFYDDEILEMARSGGIIGLQLDERRIATQAYIRSLRTNESRNKRMHSNSKMIWNNIQHIVQLLDMNDMFAWKYMAIGSDFDGMIDPINLFWTSEEMDDLLQFTERHAENYFNDPSTVFKNSANRITAAEVVDRIFRVNAFEFFRTYFK